MLRRWGVRTQLLIMPVGINAFLSVAVLLALLITVTLRRISLLVVSRITLRALLISLLGLLRILPARIDIPPVVLRAIKLICSLASPSYA